MAKIYGNTTTTPIKPSAFESDVPNLDLSKYYTKAEVDAKIGDLQEFVDDMNEDIANLYNTLGNIETLLGGI